MGELKRLGFPVIEPYVPTSVKVRESHSEKKPLVLGHPDHPVGVALRGVFEAIGR